MRPYLSVAVTVNRMIPTAVSCGTTHLATQNSRSCRRRAIAHGDVHGPAAHAEVHDQLRRFLALAGGRIGDEHAEPDRVAALEAVPQDAVFRMARGWKSAMFRRRSGALAPTQAAPAPTATTHSSRLGRRQALR